MKLAFSNIAWDKEWDKEIYGLLQKNGFEGLEIAPTRLFPEEPYTKLKEVKEYAAWLYEYYGLIIVSMQSIWFGRKENLFVSEKEQKILADYTKKAIDFAVNAGCNNLVFGCPYHRKMGEEGKKEQLFLFYNELNDYCKDTEVCFAIEPVATVYNTDYLNTTEETLKEARKIDLKHITVNLDLGTLLTNKEKITLIENNVDKISHIHISEPMLAPVVKHDEHEVLHDILLRSGYNRYVSVEMKNGASKENLVEVMEYMKGWDGK